MSEKSDRDIEAWLEGDSPVTRAFGELRGGEPPEALDRTILAAARDAVAADDATRIRVQRWRQWSLPAALAASAVIAVPLVVHVFQAPEPDVAREAAPAATPMTETGQRAGEPSFAPAPDNLFEADGAPRLQLPRERDTAEDEVRAVEADNGRAASSGAGAGSEPARPGVKARRAPPPAPRPEVDFARPPRDDAALAPTPLSDDLAAATAVEELGAEDWPIPAATDAAADWPQAVASADGQTSARSEAAQASAAADGTRANREQNSKTRSAMPTRSDTRRATTSLAAAAVIPAPLEWLDAIAALHEAGDVAEARRELGAFLTAHPDYELDADFPLSANDAIFARADDPIVQDAETWLAGIASLARAGRIDAARQQLAQFFERYPDYELPAGFPLTRADAAPIEQ